MADLLVDERDHRFVLFDQFEIQKLSESELYAEFDVETYKTVLSQAKKLATTAMMPANSVGDTEGCILKDGKVSVPKVWHDLWKKWNDGGWRGLDLPQEIDGQGMPTVFGMAVNEYFEAACLAFQTLAAMTRGAALLIATHASEELKKKYVDKIVAGKWTGTMVLTEAEAGSDLNAVKTKAEPLGDGKYSISGTKMWITGGDTGLTENIVHLVLARVKGAPAGTAGLSLFLVPKIRVNDDGSLGEPNDVSIVSIEHKMGLRGSPTCQVNYGENGNCIGELVGKENQGLPIFFTMMNESRLIAARHGASVASSAYLHAVGYAKERLQGSEIGAPKGAPQAPIIKHPDVRRMLLRMKAYTEGVRALILYASYCIDREKIATTPEERKEWEGRLTFLTPVAKAYGSDLSFLITMDAMQVYGSYGYTKDYPIEQFLRDEKVHSIFEGTNGIQALTLAGRSLGTASKALFDGHLGDINKFCSENANHETLGTYVKMLKVATDVLADVSSFLLDLQKKDFRSLALYAYQYLELFGDVTVGWLLAWQAVIADRKLKELAKEKGFETDAGSLAKLVDEESIAAFYSGKVAGARFFISNVVSLATAKAEAIKKADKHALEIAENAF
ncbi:MAG: Acyl-CoA dehydrogenase [Syntrophorhabdaceae bacterium PtaU1.Bin034]|nr:MAG: Acyl-CoA dehydrogenase [Syntrophorhabdaceae bacterium PtaU1.Bin034]